MTETELKDLVQQCAKTMSGIDGDWLKRGAVKGIKFNSRLSRALGRCKRRGTKFYLEFSTKYFDYEGTTDEEKRSVIYHELVHTVDGCFNHGEKFKLVGRKIERATGVTQIHTRTTETGDFKKDTYKYRVDCGYCSRVTYRQRSMGSSDRRGYIDNYRCGACGESLLKQSLNN
jgi:predicted SprT family Zn-dependent metalloprotease